jgi:non-ribosomal peptide synthetase-like protein
MSKFVGSEAAIRPVSEIENTLPPLLHQVFEITADMRGEHPALEYAGRILTYAELERGANQMANFLRARDIGPGKFVPLFMKKCPELFMSLLGILKAGAAYVPIDPKFPLERVGAIIEDTGAKLVLTHTALYDSLNAAIPGLALNVDAVADIIDRHSEKRPTATDVGVVPGDVCYVIFTSGSTGRPKGVMVEHHNACSFAATIGPVYGITATDRVYQGFSIAFDAAVEEVWSAWSNGGTLVIGEEDVVRSPLDVAQFLTDKRVSFFSTVPSFLAMIEQDLPTVKLLVVGGEACPSELVTRWAKDERRMLNTYGPTEATVVATYTELKSGETVSIGKPLPGYYAYVLDESMQPVKTGENGELYIGGAGVARGYINHEHLNAERFIIDPFHPEKTARLYRSFDHVRLQEDGNIGFLGRLDGQVKIRGFRVELPEIEAVLLAHPAIRATAVTVAEIKGHKHLAAYVVLANSEQTLDRQEITTLLQSRLPEYMMPKYLDIIEALPLMTSGKVDRKALPLAKTLLKAGTRKLVTPGTPMEKAMAEIWRTAIGVDEISIDDDFFLDLGGHSLVAAHVVTATRQKLNSDNISVRDLYQHRTIRKLAEHAVRTELLATQTPNASDGSNHRPTAEDTFYAQNPWTRNAVVAAQALGIYAFYAVVSAPFLAAIILIRMTLAGEVRLEDATYYATIGSFALWPSMLLFSIGLKWIVIGRYKAGRYPLWGWYYFRWWLVNRFMVLSWSDMFVGSPLMSLYFRAMGATVGRNAVINTSLCSVFDLVSIGDDTSIGAETQLLGYRVEDGMLVLGSVNIGNNCFVGMHSTFGLNTAMSDYAKLDDMSALADGDRMRPGEERRGCPSAAAQVEVPEVDEAQRKKSRPFIFGLLHLALIYVMGYFLIFTMLPSALLIGGALYYGGYAWGIGAAFLAVPVGIVWYAASAIAVKWLFVGRVTPGIHAVSSFAYLRHWFLDYLLNNTREILMPIYATTYFPTFLRLLGAKVGKNVEISTVLHVTPDLLEIGDGSFCADASLIGGKRIHNGVVEVKSNRIGARSFIGNSALVPGGADIGNNCLVGVMSTPPAAAEERVDNRCWFGSPGFILPRPNNTVSFEAGATFRPSRELQLARAGIDIVRIILPGLLAMAGGVAFIAAVIVALNALPLMAALLLAPLVLVALSFVSIGVAAGIKILLIGRFQPDMKPLYSLFVWLNEIVNAVFEGAASASMEPLLGTPFLAEPMRWMGCKIGRWVYLDTTLFSEFDLVEIGDFSALNLGTTIQTHLFEDRVMKTAGLKIGRNCTIANMSAVLYGTEMKDGSWLGPLSVLMKGETLPAVTRWQGIPSQLALPSRPASIRVQLPLTSQTADIAVQEPPTPPSCPASIPSRPTSASILLPVIENSESQKEVALPMAWQGRWTTMHPSKI